MEYNDGNKDSFRKNYISILCWSICTQTKRTHRNYCDIFHEPFVTAL